MRFLLLLALNQVGAAYQATPGVDLQSTKEVVEIE